MPWQAVLAEVDGHFLDAGNAKHSGEEFAGALFPGTEQVTVVNSGAVTLIFRCHIQRPVSVRVVPEVLRRAVEDPMAA